MKTGMVRELEDQIKKQVAAERNSEKPVDIKGGEKIILHIDMDAFFAAVEIRDNPWLKGKPIIVGGSPTGRGVVTTCSYEARGFGIHAGMPGREAARLCPNAIFLRGAGTKYVHASVQIMKILRQFSDHVEPYSIDEAFVDITHSIRLFGGARKLARAMKEEIHQKLNLTGSVGIGPNRLVAKMASRMQKPDGLTIIPREKIREIFDPLPVRSLLGIGPATEEALNRLGIVTIEQLRKASLTMLKRYFGVGGKELIRMANGNGDAMVVPIEHREHEKSMGHEHTFGEDIADPEQINAQLMYLSEKAARRLRRAGVGGRKVTLKFRTTGFITNTHQMMLSNPTNDEIMIYWVTLRLLEEIWDKYTPVRLVGVSISRLMPIPPAGYQTDLFERKTLHSRRILSPILDRICERFGENSIGSASAYFLR
jgi:DNA polymerase-4